jgi:hypothetical protein
MAPDVGVPQTRVVEHDKDERQDDGGGDVATTAVEWGQRRVGICEVEARSDGNLFL